MDENFQPKTLTVDTTPGRMMVSEILPKHPKVSFGLINRILTKKEIRVSKIIGKRLKKDNIYFAGIDFIDQQLNGDINVTSPTGLKTYYDLSKINLAKTFWKGLKA